MYISRILKKGKICLILTGVSFSLVLHACKGQDEMFRLFQDELEYDSFKVDYVIIENEGLSISKPINLDESFNVHLQDMIEEDLKFEYCSNEGASSNVYYNVGFASKKFVSIQKKVHIMFCYPSDVVYSDFVNLFLHKGVFYDVKLNRNSEITGYLNSVLTSDSIDVDCNYVLEDLELNLFFKEGSSYIFFEKDRVCNMFIPLDVRKDNIVFKVIDKP